MLGEGPSIVSGVTAVETEMCPAHSAVDHGQVILHLVTTNTERPLVVHQESRAQHVRTLLALDPLYHFHESKVLVKLPDSVSAKESLLPVEGAGDEAVISW